MNKVCFTPCLKYFNIAQVSCTLNTLFYWFRLLNYNSEHPLMDSCTCTSLCWPTIKDELEWAECGRRMRPMDLSGARNTRDGWWEYQGTLGRQRHLMIYILSSTDTVSLCHDSSVWLDTPDTSSWDQNPANFTSDG